MYFLTIIFITTYIVIKTFFGPNGFGDDVSDEVPQFWFHGHESGIEDEQH